MYITRARNHQCTLPAREYECRSKCRGPWHAKSVQRHMHTSGRPHTASTRALKRLTNSEDFAGMLYHTMHASGGITNYCTPKLGPSKHHRRLLNLTEMAYGCSARGRRRG